MKDSNRTPDKNSSKRDLDSKRDVNAKRNPDPITGEPGSHPVGTGLGAVAGGAAAGAAVGTVAGPVGTIAGAAVGAIVGGLAGKGVAESINPTREDAFWKENHDKQPYANGRKYDDYSPAYRTGYEGYGEYGSKGSFDENEDAMRKKYEQTKSRLTWDEARPASFAAWQRVHQSAKPAK